MPTLLHLDPRPPRSGGGGLRGRLSEESTAGDAWGRHVSAARFAAPQRPAAERAMAGRGCLEQPPLCGLVYLTPMEDGEDPHLVGGHSEDDATVADPKLPVAKRSVPARGTPYCGVVLKRASIARAIRVRMAARILRTSRSATRVITQGVRHLASLDGPLATAAPDRFVAQRAGSIKASLSVLGDCGQEAILLHLQGSTEQITGGRGKRRSLATCHPSERVIERLL